MKIRKTQYDWVLIFLIVAVIIVSIGSFIVTMKCENSKNDIKQITADTSTCVVISSEFSE